MDLRLKVPFTLIINGSSSCGKTSVVEKLLLNADECLTESPTEIVWAYAEHTADRERFERLRHLPISFRVGFPAEEIDRNTLFSSSGPKLLVLDDIVTELTGNRSLFSLFNVLSHHQNISVVVTVQNLVGVTPVQKSCLNTLLRSCSYLVTFANRRTLPVAYQIARTYFPGQSQKVLAPFAQLINQPYQYLVIDFVTLDDSLAVRCGGLTPDHPCYIYDEESGKDAGAQ